MGGAASGPYAPLRQDDLDKFWGQVPLFRCLPKDSYPGLSGCAQQVSFAAGQVIFKQGDAGNEFYVIKEGKADVEVDGSVLASLSPGDFFGEAALLGSDPRTATITATSSISALSISRDEFRRLGLHEKLKFPKREKLGKKHRMMAGAAGAKPSSGLSQFDNIKAPPPEERPSYCSVQMTAIKEIVFDKVNILAFLFVPIGQICKYMDMGPGVIFWTNFLAIIPLASILGAATESLAEHTGQLIGGLLNATFGNAVEMIMCFQSVEAGLIQVVQGNLLGSILSNLLLVLGMAIFAAGTARKTQKFNQQGAASNMTCQLVASISVCLPTCFAAVAEAEAGAVLRISRICSIFLLTVYAMFLYFMLKTHADLFADEGGEEEHDDVLSPTFSALLLMACTLVVFFCSECLVDSIEGVSEEYGLSKTFIGVILLPIVGNAAEHATAVTCAYKGMMDLALGVAVGSSTQIALFVVPCAIIVGWVCDKPMDLDFTVFDTTCQMLTIFLVSQVLSHGETNWLHGAMLIVVYLFIAVQCLYIKEAPAAGRAEL